MWFIYKNVYFVKTGLTHVQLYDMPKDEEELRARIKQLERQLKDKERELERQKKAAEDEKLKVEILKKSLHIFMQPPE